MGTRTGQNILKSKLNVACVKRRCLDERQVVFACCGQHRPTSTPGDQHTRKLFRLLRGHCPQMSQIALVSDQHDDDVGIGMIPQLLQPPVDILVGLMFADVVHEESTDRTTVVSRRNGPVTFLASSIPDLSLDRLGIHLDRAGCELDTDSRLGVQVEFVAGEPTQQVRFTNTRVTNQHHYRSRNPSVYDSTLHARRKGTTGDGGEETNPSTAGSGNLPLKRNYFNRPD